MIRLSCFLTLLFVVSVFAQTSPLLTVVSVTAGDYYTEVTVKMSQSGTVYVYPLPTEVQIAPDDLSIVTYGFSSNVTAGVNSVIIVEELEAKSSYNLYVTGRGSNNEVSSPSRIVKVITTLAPTPPVLTISSFIANKESIILRYSMTAAGTIWCRAYREEERDYASVEGVYTSIQGSPVVAHVLSNYYIGNLEPNTVYHTFCVAENDRQIPMSTSFQSTERTISTLVDPPYISYLGNRITYNSIEIDALTNVRANVWNYTVIRDDSYTYPSIQTVKSSSPTQVPRQQQFTMVWGSLHNDTEYAISLYSEDLKNNATEQTIPSTTFFITTDIVRCPAIDDWNETAAGSFGLLPCNTGYSGNIKRYCDYEGMWGELVNECERNHCPASGGWNATLSLVETSMNCDPGFTGTMTRYCNADGVWGAPDRSACVLLYCDAVGEWPRTPALTSHSIYCGTAFFGEKSRYCNEYGEWDDVVEEECIPKQICSAEDGWASTYEGEYMVQSCPPGYHGSISRYCGLGGSWSTIYNNCTQNICEEDGMWPETTANSTVSFSCPVGESGMITRYCSLDGIWHAMNTSQCVQIFCNEEGIWNRTLAGLTIPGPCHDGEFGSSSRTCSLSGVWQNIDYSDCFEEGCAENDDWQSVPIGITLRRDCPAGYSGYRYRHCSANGVWDPVNDDDCERLVCQEMNGFPTTLSGENVNVYCGEHYTGNMTATCSLYGQWTNIDISDCVAIPTCEEDGIWPRTNSNSSRVISCGAGISGTKSRFCNSDLVWGEVDDSQCVQLYCSPNGLWPQTIAGIMAYLECPDGAFGFVQRSCSVEGVWGEVDDSFCFETWCASYEGWPATGGGQIATLPCSAGFVGSQTRVCSVAGEWGTVNDSGCVVATCPEDGVWPETVHSTSHIAKPCPLGYYGTMYRDCSLNGTWSSVDDSMCIRKYCMPDGTWPITPSLTTVNQTCPFGYEGAIQRTCGDGVWDDVVYGCSPITCPVEDGWSATAGSTQVRDCPYGFLGTMSRHCMMDGTWGIIEDSGCTEIKCPAFGIWDEGRVDETQVKPCASGGFSLLTCTINGVWEGDPSQCYLHLCPVDGKWPITTPGTVRRSTCPDGMEGYSTRYCSATGDWFEENLSQCFQTMCTADGNWPATPRNSWATIGCPSHATGLQTRFCDSQAQWLAPELSGCVNHSCAADDEWPMTTIGDSVILTCGLGKRGYRSRICGPGGVWEEEDLSSCSQIVCYEENEWPTTNALETAQLECPDGWIGVKNRTCSAGGIWGAVEDFCKQRTCPVDGDWPETVIDSSTTISCPQGYSGTYTRYCNSTGIWEEEDMSTCTRLHCAADGMWLTTNTFENATIPCGGDLLGEIKRYCKEDQTWDEPDSSECRPNYCVADGDWPNTPINGSITLPCGTGFRGMKTRVCNANAFWNEEDQSDCLQIPSMLVLNSLPNSHFILFYTQFDIDTTMYMYPRTSGAMAPSVNDVMTKGVNKTCEAHGVCKIYVTHLTPETKYDVYYWYVSEEGAEPITPVSSMKRIVTTLAIQPYNLTIHDVQGEYDFITIAASIEDRSGYLWCRASRISAVPTLSQLKSSTPVFFGEDNGILVKIIPDLDANSVYHTYCYAEDIYGVPSSTSIADTHFTVSTLSEEIEAVITFDNSPTESLASVLINRDGKLCCDYRQDSIVPSLDDVMSTNHCIDLLAYENNTLTVPVLDDTDYLVYCAINTTTYVTIYNPQNASAIHTPSLNPTYSFVSSTSTYNMIGLSFIADRSSMLYCVASVELMQPSVDDIKQGASQYFRGDEVTEIIILSLMKETTYHVFCYGETTEGLPMLNSIANMTFTVSTVFEPPVVSVLSSSIQFDRIRLMISTTDPIAIRCIAIQGEHPIPTPIDFSEAEEVSISVLGEYTITGLEEDTSYSSYCYGEDTHSQSMANTIASTQTNFTTPFNRHSVFTSFLSQSELNAHISIVSTADCLAWCTVKHINDVYLSPAIIKQQINPVFIEKEVPTMIDFVDLAPAYSYQAYCYSESMRNMSMITTVASTALNVTTPSYPLVSVVVSPIANNPDSFSINLDITSSQKGVVFCRAREVLENELPPTPEWIRAGAALTITQQSIVHYLTISSLQPSSNYTIFCLGESEDEYESIQPLSTRSVTVMTLEDTIQPSVFITSSVSGFIIPSQPYAVNISFSEPIQDFQQSSLVLTNCRVITWSQITSQLYQATFAPLVHGEFAIKVPAGAVKDLYNNPNQELILTRYYEPKNLLITVNEIGKLFVKASISYGYPATISCIHSTSSVAPATCAALKLDSTLVSFSNAVSTEITFQDIAVNSTSYLYCCAEEPNDVLMNNSIQSTQAVVEVGWFDCPIVNNQVCNNQGTCTDGTNCICNSGYYGSNCTATCPGILSDNLMNFECSNHGTCNSATLECTCSSSEYGGSDCSLLQLEGEVPASGFSFLHVHMNLQVGTPLVSSYHYRLNQEHFIHTVATFMGISSRDIRLQRWNVNTAVRALAAENSNVQIVLNVKEAEANTKLDTLKSGTSTLQEQLVTDSFDVTSVSITKSYSTGSSNTDPFTCYDGELSSDEADVDCGGSCVKKCSKNQHCFKNEDCETNYCENNICISNLGGGMIAIIILVCLFVIAFIILLCALGHSKKNEKAAAQTEIEMVRIRNDQKMRDLEKQDKEEEEEMKQLEEKVQKLKEAKKEKPVEVTPEEAKPVEKTPEKSKPVEVTPEKSKPVEVTPEKSKPVEVTPEDKDEPKPESSVNEN